MYDFLFPTPSGSEENGSPFLEKREGNSVLFIRLLDSDQTARTFKQKNQKSHVTVPSFEKIINPTPFQNKLESEHAIKKTQSSPVREMAPTIASVTDVNSHLPVYGSSDTRPLSCPKMSNQFSRLTFPIDQI